MCSEGGELRQNHTHFDKMQNLHIQNLFICLLIPLSKSLSSARGGRILSRQYCLSKISKMPNSGVFCGLHVDTKSTSSRCATPDQSTSLGPAIQANQRRPHSLTLPFENRERRSHLVSEEEFDKIIRRAKLDQPLPPLPPGVCNDVPQHRKRSSISVATNPRISSLSQRPRPMSADFSTVISTIANRHEAALQIPRALPKDLTLTALPRPPTKNDLISMYQYLCYRFLS